MISSWAGYSVHFCWGMPHFRLLAAGWRAGMDRAGCWPRDKAEATSGLTVTYTVASGSATIIGRNNSPSARGDFARSRSSDDVLTPAGRVEDVDRMMFMRNHLTHLHRAASEGYSVKGYFLWSLLDNFEWADGYSKRFGIHYVDFKTQKRTLKLSAEWYREVIAKNAVE